MRRVLNHPATMKLKHAVRDVRWRLKGRSIQSSPLPGGVRSVLFVCLGNICRSPFAGVLAAQRLATAVRPIRCGSAGIAANPDARPPFEAREEAAAYGVQLGDHRPVLLTRRLVDTHDLIVVMESHQAEQLRAAYPDAADRVVLLSMFDPAATGYERYNIEDPFTQPRSAYAACYRRIDRAVAGLVGALRETPEP